jgi:hypothetical protein
VAVVDFAGRPRLRAPPLAADLPRLLGVDGAAAAVAAVEASVVGDACALALCSPSVDDDVEDNDDEEVDDVAGWLRVPAEGDSDTMSLDVNRELYVVLPLGGGVVDEVAAAPPPPLLLLDATDELLDRLEVVDEVAVDCSISSSSSSSDFL